MFVDGRPETFYALFAFGVAALVAWLLVPVAERVAWRIGAVDYPNERSLHTDPTPKLGGLAIFVAISVATVLFLPWAQQTQALLVGAVVITAVGVVDDVFDLNPLLKLSGQTVAAAIPVLNGVNASNFTLPFIGGVDLRSVEFFDVGLLGTVHLGHVLTIVGIVAVINVINLIDGVDGLAAGVCAISAAALSVIALSLDKPGAGVLAALTAGGALGFLRHGFPPASSFMGDTGSNLLGYLLGAIAVQGALKTNTVVALVFPLVVLAVPILDTGFVIAKRIKYRQPIYRADRWHFHHRMANIGFSQRRTLAYLYGWALVMAGLALALRFVPYSDDHGNFDPLWTAVIGVCLVAAFAASVYLVITLEILKLRRQRSADLADRRGGPVADEIVDEEVAHELETGEFRAVEDGGGGGPQADREGDR
jgi:UDP-GlcNAc:undecaprenyl-phosphate GlcNAc-1-phosphate transferase